MKQMSFSRQGHVVQPASACVHLAFLAEKSDVILYYMLRVHIFICNENLQESIIVYCFYAVNNEIPKLLRHLFDHLISNQWQCDNDKLILGEITLV